MDGIVYGKSFFVRMMRGFIVFYDIREQKIGDFSKNYC